MQKRKSNIMFNKSGSGSRTTRITLPVPWVDTIGATQEDRTVFIYQVGKQIIISKEAMKMEKEKAVELAKEEVKKEIKEKGFISDSDGDYYLYNLVKEIIEMLSEDEEVEDNIEEYRDEIIDEIIKFLKDNFNTVSNIFENGNAVVYYYDYCFNFKTVEDLENHFKIGE